MTKKKRYKRYSPEFKREALKRAEGELALPYQKGFYALDLEGDQPTSAKVNQ